MSMEQFLPRRTLIVEDEKDVQTLIQMTFKDHGIREVYCVSDGEEAWKELQKYDYELLVLDWKLPVLSGKRLLNRIRADRRLKYLPIIVLSGFLETGDVTFVNENFFTANMQKPFNQDDLMKISRTILRDRFDFQKIFEKAEETFFNLSGQGLGRVREVLNTWLQNFGQNPVGTSLVASIMRHFHIFDHASSIISTTMTVHKNNPLLHHQQALNQLCLGNFTGAFGNLEKAHQLCPINQGRILLLGKLAIHQGDLKTAVEYFKKAEELDSGSPSLKRCLEIVEFVEHRMGKEKVEDLENGIASLLNIMGADKVRQGLYLEGQEHCEHALIFAKSPDAKAAIYYNLGICEARRGNKKEAVSYFYRSIDIRPNYTNSINALEQFGIDVMNAG